MWLCIPLLFISGIVKEIWKRSMIFYIGYNSNINTIAIQCKVQCNANANIKAMQTAMQSTIRVQCECIFKFNAKYYTNATVM